MDFQTRLRDKIEGTNSSYLQYYKEKYGIEIQDLDQPLFVHKQRIYDSDQKPVTKIIHLVPELCKMTGLEDRERSNY